MDVAPQAVQRLATMTPMMAQYHDIKERAGTALLFFRMGDFYELFFDDAVQASKALDITLTRRGKKDGDDIPMCGVPFHAAEGYLAKLISKGFSVAICEQTEDPATAKKRGAKSVVARDIVRIVTPGTVTEESLLDAREHNYLAALSIIREQAALAWVDVSTGDVWVQEGGVADIVDACRTLRPAELLVADQKDLPDGLSFDEMSLTPIHASQFDPAYAEDRVAKAYEASTTQGFGELAPTGISALGALFAFLDLTQRDAVPMLRPPRLLAVDGSMAIDTTTRRSLELTEAAHGGRQGSLLSVIDSTKTASGGRLLSRWLATPLCDVDAIAKRQDAVAWFVDSPRHIDRIVDALKGAPDLMRSLSRLSLGRGGPRDLAAIRDGIAVAASLGQKISDDQVEPSLPIAIGEAIEPFDTPVGGELSARLGTALAEELPLLARDGGFLAEGFDGELDELRTLRTNAKQVIADLESTYREKTGIKSLKIKHSKVMGYLVEVTVAHADRMTEPELAMEFRQRQTMANAVRYTTPELADLDARIVRAGEGALALELKLFEELRAAVLEHFVLVSEIADGIAAMDVFSGLAVLARDKGLIRPQVDTSRRFEIDRGRHLVVEKTLDTDFIPNNCHLSDGGVPELLLVTGPNMAGKSTYLRQNALIAILAQMGSFVPAQSAHIGVVDRLFSRVGSSDDLARGRSTFMVEMVETAAILNQATPRSLVILDEVGRGTSTFDGLSIAWAALEHLHDKVKCRGLFATHYHELTSLAHTLKRLRNVSVSAREWRGKVIFLHEVKEGPADRSYGIAVAKLAGVPAPVLTRASQVLETLEAARDKDASSLPLFEVADPPACGDIPSSTSSSPWADMLDDIDPDQLSPKEALDVLYRLKAEREGV